MAENRGKRFEQEIRKAFSKVQDVSIDRLHDQTTGYKNSSANICDFIVYKKPHEYYIECKSVHGNTLPFTNITDNQWNGMMEKCKINGVRAGVICWWIDHDITLFIPIQLLTLLRENGKKSLRYDETFYGYNNINPYYVYSVYVVPGNKKRVFFDYDMTKFFELFGE